MYRLLYVSSVTRAVYEPTFVKEAPVNLFRRIFLSVMTVFVLLSGSVLPSFAQAEATTYSISGRVTDAGGNGVAGVTITAEFMPTATDYRIILLPGVMGTKLSNAPDTSSTMCADHTNGVIWVDLTRVDDISPLYLGANGTGSRSGCDVVSPRDGSIRAACRVR